MVDAGVKVGDLQLDICSVIPDRTNHRFGVRRTDIRYFWKAGYIFSGTCFPEVLFQRIYDIYGLLAGK